MDVFTTQNPHRRETGLADVTIGYLSRFGRKTATVALPATTSKPTPSESN
jgi:hypothetical protein